MVAAMARVGATTIAELAEKVDMNTPNHVRQFYKWWDGENRPRLDKAIPLMEKTGMLVAADPASQPAGGWKSAAIPRDPLEALIATAADLVENQELILDALNVPKNVRARHEDSLPLAQDEATTPTYRAKGFA